MKIIFLTIQNAARSFARDWTHSHVAVAGAHFSLLSLLSVISWGNWTVGFREKEEGLGKSLQTERPDI